MMLHNGAGHSSNCQITLKLLGYDLFCYNLQHKKYKANLEISEVLITYITNMGEARVTFHIRAGHSNINCQIILKLFGCDSRCKKLQHKRKLKANLEVSEVLITYVTNRGRLG